MQVKDSQTLSSSYTMWRCQESEKGRNLVDFLVNRKLFLEKKMEKLP